jgi:tetratricopeptide (TPR) repeat protein
MKNQILISIIITSSFSFNNWAQASLLNGKKIEKSQPNSSILNDHIDKPTRKVKYYHVEESVQMKFGGHKTVYDVTDLRLIENNNSEANKGRIITPVFQESEQLVKTSLKAKTLNKIENSTKQPDPENTKSVTSEVLASKEQIDETVLKLNALNKTENSTNSSISVIPQKVDIHNLDPDNKTITPSVLAQKEKLDETAIKLNAINKTKNSAKLSITDTPKKVDTSAYIDVIETYERVVEKGYEPIDILKKLADSYFFNDQLEIAEKYYTKLFNKTTDLEPVYYYRYSAALKAKGEIEMADQYLKKFNALSDND